MSSMVSEAGEMSDRVGDALKLVAAITSAPTLSKAMDAFERAVEPFGVRLYRADVIMGIHAASAPLDVSNIPTEWIEHVIGARTYLYDPVDRALRRGRSFSWRDAS